MDQVTRDVDVFFQLAAAVSLSHAEEQALLDVPAATLVAIRSDLAVAPPGPARWDSAKLRRRLEYAIPILQRMLASIAS